MVRRSGLSFSRAPGPGLIVNYASPMECLGQIKSSGEGRSECAPVNHRHPTRWRMMEYKKNDASVLRLFCYLPWTTSSTDCPCKPKIKRCPIRQRERSSKQEIMSWSTCNPFHRAKYDANGDLFTWIREEGFRPPPAPLGQDRSRGTFHRSHR